MKLTARRIPRLYLQWASAPHEGMTLELIEANGSGEMIDGGLYPAATIVADDDETQWIEIYPEGGPVRIPVAEFEQAIELARKDVHGESYYDAPTDRLPSDT
jgi:hypothetical protein